MITTIQSAQRYRQFQRHFPCRPKKVFFGLLLTLLTLGFSRPMEVLADPCVPLLDDGSLEDGTNWQSKNNDGFALISQQLARTGSYWAYLGGRNNIADRLATTVSLPDTDQAITLRFWWQLQSQESTGQGGDRLAVMIANANGIPVQSLAELSARDVTDNWRSRQLDLSHFANRTIQLQFLASTDHEHITDFFIDDIEILACD